jgi:hypothetical protein
MLFYKGIPGYSKTHTYAKTHSFLQQPQDARTTNLLDIFSF